ncbi:MAG: Uma2 family endonuclease [Candidatus Wallbacteria bacterium]|nr:Uma2 family endonuclease [Candidatus Wallbacteria bacterium]
MEQPAPKRLTWADYELTPDDGFRYEVLEGQLVREPAPSHFHQKTSWRLCALLARWQSETGDRGDFVSAPADVELGLHAIVQPDILYIRAERVEELVAQHVKGAPDLAVEIFNRSGAARDGVQKLQIYAKYGVREYWLVDLDAGQVMMLELVDGMYQAFAQGTGDDRLESHVLRGFGFRPAEILAAER